MLASALLSWHDKREHAALIKNSNNLLLKLFQTDVDNIAHRLPPFNLLNVLVGSLFLYFISSRVLHLYYSLSAVWVEFRPLYFHASPPVVFLCNGQRGRAMYFHIKRCFICLLVTSRRRWSRAQAFGTDARETHLHSTTCKFKFFNLDKCISLSKQIHLAIQRNTFNYLDKYI